MATRTSKTSKAGGVSRSSRAIKTKRQKLHHLVDDLPPREVEAALRYVAYLRSMVDPGLRKLVEAPYDDEPLTEEDKAAIKEGLADFKAGRVLSMEEVKRELGL